MKVIFENENFVACDKAAGVLSVPARERDDPRPCLGLQLQTELGRQVFPVHRLDFEVSGIILYALNAKSHQESQRWFSEKQIQKTYLALTSKQSFQHWPLNISTDRSAITAEAGQKFFWKTQIFRGKKRSFESPNGEWGETQALLEKIEDERLTWQLHPLTGKPHQLRFELSRRGFPIWGDKLYGSDHAWAQGGIALRAYELDLRLLKNRMGLPEMISVPLWSDEKC